MMIVLGFVFLLGGMIIAYKRDITIRYRYSYLANPITITFTGSSATILGFTWIAAAVFLGTGARVLHWMTISGSLETVFSLRYGFVFAMGMGLIGLIISGIMQVIEGR